MGNTIYIPCPPTIIKNNFSNNNLKMKLIAISQFSKRLNKLLIKNNINPPEIILNSAILYTDLDFSGLFFYYKSNAIKQIIGNDKLKVIYAINPLNPESEPIKLQQHSTLIEIETEYYKYAKIVVKEMEKLPIVSIIYKYQLNSNTLELNEDSHLIYGGYDGYVDFLKCQVDEYEKIQEDGISFFSKKKITDKKRNIFKRKIIRRKIKETKNDVLYCKQQIKNYKKNIEHYKHVLKGENKQ